MTADPTRCATCGEPHAADRCQAHRRDGGQCRGKAVRGLSVCRMHGGGSPRAKAAAARRVAEEEARRAVVTLGLAVDVSPTEALLEEVRWTAGHVRWLRERVQQLGFAQDDEAGIEATSDRRHPLVWGTTEESVKVGGDDHGTKTVEKAAPSIWYDLYQRERRHLVDVAAAALRAGVEERRVQLAEQQGAQLATVIRAILDDLGLTPKQQTLVGEVVPRHLRAIAGAGT